ncbi:hypothetical protein LIER_23918 [Lithospermum erythrorhizon]|uniref:Uncharacterized protein n=1 Tax=Lithospermum erythrorhizon TaxID=34254 RepID=A0AAV3QZE2_LITER
MGCKTDTKEVASKLSNNFKGCEAVELLGRLVGSGYLAYERVPNLYFHCGLLGHFIHQYPKLPEGADPRKQVVYGLWIKAPLEKSWVEFRVLGGQDSRSMPSLMWVTGEDD